MLISFALALAIAQTGQAAQAPDAAHLISAMISRYAGANTVAGKIRLVEESMGVSYQVDTTVAVERPDLIYLQQSAANNSKPPASLVSDGVQFIYSSPSTVSQTAPKLKESMHPGVGRDLHVKDIYYCAFPTLLDRSLPLDLVVSRDLDLKALKVHFSKFNFKGATNIRNVPVYEVDGEWKDDEFHGAAATFSLFLTPDGDLVRFQKQFYVAVSAKWIKDNHVPSKLGEGVQVTCTWDTDLKVNETVNHALFSLRPLRR